jgi:glycosyltransferase involved in cell wall biosynthesis
MKLLHIIPTYKPAYCYGGPIISIGLLTENLAATGHDVWVAATTANGKQELPAHTHTPTDVNGVKVLYFPRWTKDHSQFSPALLVWLWRNMRRFDAVHIHSWWNLSVLFATMLCILRGVKPILSPRGMLSTFTIQGKWKPIFHKFLGKKLLSKTHLHATAMAERAECLELIPDWKNTVLPNFLDIAIKDLPIRLKKESDTFRILFLSRIHEKKGVDTLLSALVQVPFKWTLSIAGDGEAAYIAQLQQQAQELGIADRVKWLGFVQPEARFGVFEAADVLVLPSHNENFANVVIESLSVGTPVLVSQYVGLKDYILEKKLGWVCDTTAISLRETLTEAYLNPSERQRISAQSPQQIRQDFAPSVLTGEYLKMYEAV